MPFFDQPGSTAGPYHTPARQGIFSQIMQGVDVALKLGDFYQNWQTKSQAQKTGALKGLADQIGITQALNQGGTAASPEIIAQSEKTGIPLPKMTEAGRTKQSEAVMGGIAPTAGEAVPGGMATRLRSPELAQKQEAYTQGMADIPAVGTPMIPGKKPTTLEAAMLQNLSPEEQKEAWKSQHAKTTYGIQNPDGSITNTGGMRVTVAKPPGETPAEKDKRQKGLIDYRNQNRPTGGGRGGGGRPDVMTAAKEKNEAYLKYIQIPGNEGVSRVDFNTIWESSKTAGRGTQTTKTDPRGKISTSIIEPLPSKPKPTTFDKAFEQGAVGIMGSTSAPAAGQQYVLPKGGQMVPVDKETYDAYQKKYGL